MKEESRRNGQAVRSNSFALDFLQNHACGSDESGFLGGGRAKLWEGSWAEFLECGGAMVEHAGVFQALKEDGHGKFRLVGERTETIIRGSGEIAVLTSLLSTSLKRVERVHFKFCAGSEFPENEK